MNSFFTIILIALSLSMDAFSLALIYGMSSLSVREKVFLSLTVGLYHFIMPVIGLQFGKFINSLSFVDIDFIAGIILLYIGIDLIFSGDKTENKLTISVVGFLLFGLSVSIDSLSVGIGLRALTDSCYLSALTFALTSAFFTYLGLFLGNIIGKKIGTYSKITGGIILIFIALMTVIN